MIDTSFIFNSISAICLIIATVFTYHNYSLIKTIDNENHFFKHKMESYQALIVSLYQLMDEYQENWYTYKEFDEKGREKNHEEYLNKYLDSGNKFRKNIIRYSLLVPNEIIDELQSFYDMFMEEVNEELSDDDIEYFIVKCIDKNEEIANKMRAEINIEPINNKLKRRTFK